MWKKSWLTLWCSLRPVRSWEGFTGLMVWGTVVALLGVGLSACGYRFSVEGGGPTIGGPSRVEVDGPLVRLTVRNFLNRSFFRDLEYKYTNYVRKEFSVSGGAEVLFEEAGADFLLKGEIVSVKAPSVTFSGNQTREQRVVVTVRVTIENRKTGQIVWSQNQTGSAVYFVNQSSDQGATQDDLQFNQVLQERALEQAGQTVAELLAGDFWSARDQGIFALSSQGSGGTGGQPGPGQEEKRDLTPSPG